MNKEPKMSWYYLTPDEKVEYLGELYEQIPDTTINQDEKQHNINKYSNSEFESGDDEGYGILIETLEQIIATIEKIKNLEKFYEKIPFTIISKEEREKEIKQLRLSLKQIIATIEKGKGTLIGGKKLRKSRKSRKQRKSRKSRKSRKQRKSKKSKSRK